MRRAVVLAFLMLLFVLCWSAALPSAAATRVGVRLMPFTGVTLPHQQLADYRPSLPVGVGLEVLYGERFGLALDMTTSWHRGGPGGDGNVQISSLQILGRWRWPGDTWTPFVEAGGGGYQAELDEGRGEAPYGGVGAALGAGIERMWTDRLGIQLEVRSNWVQGEETLRHRERWIGHTQALVWLVYRLP